VTGRECKCGCGERIPSSKRYVNKEHQLLHMRAGEAGRLNQLQSLEAKRLGGHRAGTIAAENGSLSEASRLGAARSKAIAEAIRKDHDRTA
jgi:hypothetical protein